MPFLSKSQRKRRQITTKVEETEAGFVGHHEEAKDCEPMATESKKKGNQEGSQDEEAPVAKKAKAVRERRAEHETDGSPKPKYPKNPRRKSSTRSTTSRNLNKTWARRTRVRKRSWR